MGPRRYLLIVLLLTAAGLAACGGEGESTSGSDPGAAEDAFETRNFTVETFDGDTFELAEQRGTPVVINFWESW